MEKENAFIYKIENKLNNMVYIGSSITMGRFTQHRNNLRYGCDSPRLQAAYNKYGGGNFETNIIFHCKPKERIMYEQAFIDLLKNTGLLYNINPIAEIQMEAKPVDCYSLDQELLYQFNSITEASHKMRISDGSIVSACKGKHRTAGGYFWAYRGQKPNFRPKNKPTGGTDKYPCCYNKNGNLIKKYKSTRDAAMVLGVSIKRIQCACRGDTMTLNGMYWAYNNNKPVIRERKKGIKKWRKIYCCDKNNNILRVFNSAKEAAIEYNRGIPAIFYRCKINLFIDGCIWKYAKYGE